MPTDLYSVRRGRLLSLLIAAPLMAASLAEAGEPAEPGVSVEAVPIKDAFDLMEPITLRIAIKNKGMKPAELLQEGYPYRVAARRRGGDGRDVECPFTMQADAVRPRSFPIVGRNSKSPVVLSRALRRPAEGRPPLAPGGLQAYEPVVNLIRDTTIPGDYELAVEVHYRSPLPEGAADATPNPTVVARSRPVRVAVRSRAFSGPRLFLRPETSKSVDEAGRVEVELAAPMTYYNQSDPLPVRVTVHNRGDRPIRLRAGTRTSPARFDLKARLWAPYLTGGDLHRDPTAYASSPREEAADVVDEGPAEIEAGGRAVYPAFANLVRDMSDVGMYVLEAEVPYRADDRDGDPIRIARSGPVRVGVNPHPSHAASTGGGLGGVGGSGIGGGFVEGAGAWFALPSK